MQAAEKIKILVELLEDRQWDYQADDGRGSYSFCSECGADNRKVKGARAELKHLPHCRIAQALTFAAPEPSSAATTATLTELVAWAAIEAWFDRNPTGIADTWTPLDDVTQKFLITIPQPLYERIRDAYRERCTVTPPFTGFGCLA